LDGVFVGNTTLTDAAPGLFRNSQYGDQQALAINQDGSMNSGSHPAAIGDMISLFATGEGLTDPPGVDGKPAVQPLPQPILPVAVTIGSQPAQVQWAGEAPGTIGQMRVDVIVPDGIPTGGPLPVQLQVGDAFSQPGMYISVR
jgi:uncharacterized protein (TIGR03437 family)